MRLCDVNEWLEGAEKARFHLPYSPEALEEEDVIDGIIDMIRSISLERSFAGEAIRNLQEEARKRFLKFNIFV